VSVSWQTPRFTYGQLEGYKLTYGVLGESYVEERRFKSDRLQFTTGYLGNEQGIYIFRVIYTNS